MAQLLDLENARTPASRDVDGEAPRRAAALRKSRASRLVLVVWGALVSLMAAQLLATHLLALPAPARLDPRLVAGVSSLPHEKAGWSLVHFLYEDCACSARVLERLVRRGVVADGGETIIVVGELAPARAEAAKRAGFALENMSVDEVESRFGAVAAPLLVVAAPDGTVRYAGGYTTRKQAPFIADVSVFERLRGGETVEPLPLFGCPVSERLVEKTDPLGLR